MKSFPILLCVVLVMTLVAAGPVARGQAQGADASGGMVTLNFPDSLDLKVLVDYVGKRTGLNFIYDQQAISRRITLNAPQPIPSSSLLTLLESVLHANNLVLVETEIPGTLRITGATGSMPSISVLPGEEGEARATQAVTRVFTLKHVSAASAGQLLMPFLSSQRAQVMPVPDSQLLIITELGSNLKRLERLIEMVDQPAADVAVESVRVRHAKAADLVARASQLLSIRAQGSNQGQGQRLNLYADARTNQIDVIGEADAVARALALIENLDRASDVTTKVYRFSNIGPDRIGNLMDEMLDEVAKQSYRAVSDPESNSLIVTALPEVHAQVAELSAALDLPRPEQSSPIRFYTLQNARAKEIIETLEGLQGNQGYSGLGEGFDTVSIDGVSSAPEQVSRTEDYSRIDGPREEEVNPRASLREVSSSSRPSGISIADEDLGLDKARIIAHEETNTIIVIARPEMHDVYEKLIRRLDVRQPQVLLEATIVALDTTDGYQFGVEILVDGGLGESARGLSFSSFGLSDDVDPGNPGLVLDPGIGFNGAIISPNVADVVIRALKSDNRVRVVSQPEILVNNNAEGSLVSEREEPFSAVNASSTVSTTSFGGFAAAGTTIRVTPQISEGEHIKLAYEIELSSFSEAAEADTVEDVLPPARQTNSLVSEAVLPDGYTMIVGGLTRENASEVVNALPILGQIPVIKYLFSDRVVTTQQQTLFIFIKAVILRDDKFEYLKYVSSEAAARSGVSLGLPESEPIAIY